MEQKPTPGRIVHFYPSQYHREFYLKDKINAAEFLPAMLVQECPSAPVGLDSWHLSVFTPLSGVVSVPAVVYKEAKEKHYANQMVSYWAWPPRQ